MTSAGAEPGVVAVGARRRGVWETLSMAQERPRRPYRDEGQGRNGSHFSHKAQATLLASDVSTHCWRQAWRPGLGLEVQGSEKVLGHTECVKLCRARSQCWRQAGYLGLVHIAGVKHCGVFTPGSHCEPQTLRAGVVTRGVLKLCVQALVILQKRCVCAWVTLEPTCVASDFMRRVTDWSSLSKGRSHCRRHTTERYASLLCTTSGLCLDFGFQVWIWQLRCSKL